ncbi:YjgN family protein [Pontibacter ramchanderi]|nr:YjgN family protein [Pontibacter ramchanderi]
MIDNVRFGNVRLRYVGDGADLFLINIKGYLFSIFTLGVYFFWYTKNLLHFYVNNIVVLQEDGTYSRLQCHVSGWDVLKLTVGNLLIVVFTLGLGVPFTTTRTMALIMNNTVMSGHFDADALVQTEAAYDSATYESMTDMMDIGVI